MFTRFLAILCVILPFSNGIYTISAPPSPDQAAKMARYIMRNSDWVSVATISTQKDIKGYPFVSLKSVSEGTATKSTGTPFLYMTDIDVSGADIKVNNKCTIMASLAESDYCKQKSFDPQDPRCAKLIITGKMVKVESGSDEYEFGKEALFYKHPSMKWWPVNHDFYVAKVEIEQIEVLDFFGGIKQVSLDDYFNSTSKNRSRDVFFAKIGVIVVDVD